MFVLQIIIGWFLISTIFSLMLGSFLSLTGTDDPIINDMTKPTLERIKV